VTDLRRGRTTVVCTVSPLWLHHADRVVQLRDGVVVAEGDHAELLAGDPAYRRVVARALDDDLDPAPEPALDRGPVLGRGLDEGVPR
jgi:ABC-type transport system involved in cytochrome bd biosynthesis fused ATPase/permease subunit